MSDLKFRVTTAGTLAAAMLLAAPALAVAQDQPYDGTAACPAVEEDERIVVTGSRIKRDRDSIRPYPTRVVMGQDFGMVGAASTADGLRRAPMMSGENYDRNYRDTNNSFTEERCAPQPE